MEERNPRNRRIGERYNQFLRRSIQQFQRAANHEPESMEWARALELCLDFVKTQCKINPKERTEKGFFECIAGNEYLKKQLIKWLDSCKTIHKESTKDNKKALQLKGVGNEFFKNKDYPSSVHVYTQSARFATSNNDNFSMAIANRSAAFFHMDRFKESLQDIELAIKTGYPKALLWKLHSRAAQCHLKLRQSKLAEESLAELQRIAEGDITEALKETILKQVKDLSISVSESQKKKNVPSSSKKAQHDPENLLKKNPIFPFASTAVVRKRSPTRGRFVAAAQPIKKGDILFVEKPFAWVAVPRESDVSACDHCCGPMDDALVPCRRCVDVSYCNSTCWNEAWSYHQWECPGYHLALWPQIGISHLALKMFLRSVTTTDKVWFNDVQKLATNVEIIETKVGFDLGITSLMLTIYLEKYTDFFETVDLKECLVDKFDDPKMSFDLDISSKMGKQQYVGLMILRHSLQALSNAYGVERRVTKSALCEERVHIAEGVYASAAMLNHSCDPSVIFSFCNDWLVVKALKDVKAGEEIFTCYGPHFMRKPKETRQRNLLRQFCFNCQCSACMNPLYDRFTDRFDGFKCPECSGPSMRSPASGRQRCLDCGATSPVTCTAALKTAAELYDRGVALTNSDKWKEAIPWLEKSLAIREKHLYRHNENLAITLDALGKAYASTGDWLKSTSYLERLIPAIEERCGSDDMDLAYQLTRIAEVYSEYLTHLPSRAEKQEYEWKAMQHAVRALKIIRLNTHPWHEEYQVLNDQCELFSQLVKLLAA